MNILLIDLTSPAVRFQDDAAGREPARGRGWIDDAELAGRSL